MTDTLREPSPGYPVPDRHDQRQAARPPEPTPAERRAALVRLLAVLGILAGMAVATGTWKAVLVIVALFAMIMLHEFGHFVTARWAGMKVTEFFVGFGPRLWSVRKGETEYGVKAIPLGGYVRIIGMNNLDKVDPEDEPRTYRRQAYHKRLIVALAGSTMHFILALVLLFSLFSFVGTPNYEKPVVGELARLPSGESPAVDAGLQLGDRLVSYDGRPADDWERVRDYMRARPGQSVDLVVEREGQRIELTAELARRNVEGEAVGFLGVAPDYPRETEAPLTAVRRSGDLLVDGVGATFTALGDLFSPSGVRGYFDTLSGEEADAPAGDATGEPAEGNRVNSVIGIGRLASQAANEGWAQVLGLLIGINVFVGIFNLLPLPPLDGGLVAIASYEKVRSMISGRRHQVDMAKLLPVAYAVVFLFIALSLSAMYLDLRDPMSNPFE